MPKINPSVGLFVAIAGLFVAIATLNAGMFAWLRADIAVIRGDVSTNEKHLAGIEATINLMVPAMQAPRGELHVIDARNFGISHNVSSLAIYPSILIVTDTSLPKMNGFREIERSNFSD